jgi:hypothetical protein
MSVVQKNSNSATAGIDKVSRRVRANGDGSIFKDKKRNRWIASFYDFKHVRRVASFRKKAESFAEPIENPTEEVLKIFRMVSTFNGYNVFGDELASIATSVAENWSNTGELPEEIEKIKGALFFEFRRTHHTGQYPEGADLLYVKALGQAIDEHV